MPTGLSSLARQEWKRIVPLLMQAGVLTRLDGSILRLYCEAHADYILAGRAMRKEGRFYTSENGMKRPHPAVAQHITAERRMTALLQQLAMTPLARTRIRLEPVTPDDPMDEFTS